MDIIDFIDFSSVTSALSKNPMMQHLFLAVTDTNGRVLSNTPWRRVCKEFHRVNKFTLNRCQQSDIFLANQTKLGENYAMYTCFNNLTDAAAPIVVNGEQIGNLVVGQVFTAPPDMDFFMRQAAEFGFDSVEYGKAISEVPVVNEAELKSIMEFYTEITSLLGTVASQAYQYKELTDKLARRTAELEYTNGELESFSYSVSHDLRAPLRHIMGFIELFNKKCGKDIPEQGVHYLDVINSSTQRMSALIEDLLQFSRNGRAEMKKATVDLNDIVGKIINVYAEINRERNIRWIVGRFPPVFCDGIMLESVWRNLIDNAVKFTKHEREAIIEIGCMDDRGKQVYFIRDNGVGFDMKYAQKLFGVFQRMHTGDEFEGTGIGLATVKRIVSRHGGRIWADAAPQSGAAFYFTLSGKGD